ncbi:hypothetical protein NFI96_016534 [Prochilodus magdalenae]|nr:hypothetical protein NFI96_016534 [Prochilodus magdalenae]
MSRSSTKLKDLLMPHPPPSRHPPSSRPPPPLLYQTVVSAGSCWSVCVLCVFFSPPPVCTVSTETELKGGGADGGADGVVYTLVNIMSRGQNRLKKNRVERSDICTYSEVVYDQT